MQVLVKPGTPKHVEALEISYKRSAWTKLEKKLFRIMIQF